MPENMKLVQNKDGTYDVVIQYNNNESEFALEFLSKDKYKSNYKRVSEFIEKKAKNVKINAVRIMLSGMLIATIPLMSFVRVSAATNDVKYSMAYLYSGTVQEQIDYVYNTNNSLQTVSPSYFDINEDGSLEVKVSQELVDAMHAKGIRVVPFLSNHWIRTAGINALKDVELLSTQIADYVSQYDLDGINVDIENVTEQQRDQYTELVRLLREKIPADKEISVAVAANPKDWKLGWHGSYDYAALGNIADYLMIMTYDEHYESGEAGPVASIGFVENSIKYALSKTSSDKVVIGLPLYGRIWGLDDTSIVGKGIGINQVNQMIQDYGAVVTFDEESQSPKAEFEIKEGDVQHTILGKVLKPGRYVVWYENEQSYEAKLKLVQKYNLKGAGSWALGKEDASIWNNYSTWLNGNAASDTQDNLIHMVMAGDSLWLIAQKYGTTIDALKSLNNLTGDTIYVDQQIRIPTGNTSVEQETPGVPQEEQKTSVYTVMAGDTLWRISQTFGTTVDAIKALNNLSSNIISIGQQIVVPIGDTTVTPETPQVIPETPQVIPETPQVIPETPQVIPETPQLIPETPQVESDNTIYTVAAGDTLWKISRTFGTTVDAIKALNNLSSDVIKVGQQLTVHGSVTNIQETTAWVKKGTTNLNVRSGASTSSSIIKKINGGTQLIITGSLVNNFYPIRLTNGQTGYVSADYVTTNPV